MSGGRFALRGFDYQVTVSLDLLLRKLRLDWEAHPEGIDDLEFRSISAGHNGEHWYFQIKKPRETGDAEPTEAPWSLADVVGDLLPGTLERLRGNTHRQTWVLGDDLDASIVELLNAGASAPTEVPETYLCVLHLLARNSVGIAEGLPSPDKIALQRWRPAAPGDQPVQSLLSKTIADFVGVASTHGASQVICAQYDSAMLSLHAYLPDVLARTSAETTFGSETEVRRRVQDALGEKYPLDQPTIQHSLVRNLRGLIQDIATQGDRWIDLEELEFELRSVWPRMNLVGEPPTAEPTDLPRAAVVEQVTEIALKGSVEVTGASGSGKTKLAAEILASLRRTRPEVQVVYAAVRSEHGLRDALAGVAFHLRRFGFDEPFRAIVDQKATDEAALRELWRTLQRSPRQVLAILDFVEGTCSDAFARELALLLEGPTGQLHILALGQESAFREITSLERLARGIPAAFDVPGFNFNEFAQLVALVHGAAPDRSELGSVFDAFTAGRSAGLLARLANMLARSSVEQMRELAALPPQDALAEADRRRFAAIPEPVGTAARRLVCFALPFHADEAASVFDGEHIAEAMRELQLRGLLRRHDSELWEMHETIRAGLERMLPPSMANETHFALAEHYLRVDNVTAAIHHFERAERADLARKHARDNFLAGRHRHALAQYVGKHRLVSSEEALAWLTGPLPSEAYLVPDLLVQLADPSLPDKLVNAIREQGERFCRDYQWACSVCEAVLACAPARLHDLVAFAVTQPVERNDCLEFVSHAARRRSPVVTQELVAYFETLDDEVKDRVAISLLQDPRRSVLSPVLAFLSRFESVGQRAGARRALRSIGGSPLRLRTQAEVTEFLASLPLPEVSEMITLKSVLLENLEEWCWSERLTLQSTCRQLLEGATDDEAVLVGALRVLVFLGDASAVEIAERFAKQRSNLGSLAAYVPTLMPEVADPRKYEAVLFDSARSTEDRLGAFSILSFLGADLDELFRRVIELYPEMRRFWGWCLLTVSVHRPCLSAIPFVEEALAEKDSVAFAPVVSKLGELPGEEVSDFLLRMLKCPSANARMFACLALQTRRHGPALRPLLEHVAKEPNEAIAKNALVAAIASAPTNISEFSAAWATTPDSELWRCILAGRLRASTEIEHLVEVASDTQKHWQVRRAAILAAGRMPTDAPIVAICEKVFQERSSLTDDKHHALEAHRVIAWLVLEETRGMFSRFVAGQTRFVSVFGPILEGCLANQCNVPSGNEAATWLYDALARHGWPNNNEDAADAVIRELHVPILQAAVMCGLRRHGRRDVLEQFMSTADTLWFLIRLICEWRKIGPPTSADAERLRLQVTANPLSTSPYIANTLKHVLPSAKTDKRSQPNDAPSQPPARLSLEDIGRALATGVLPKGSLVLTELAPEQLVALGVELSPLKDRVDTWVPSKPHLSLIGDGRFTVRGTRGESSRDQREIRSRLRAALVAANDWRKPLGWHRDLLVGHGMFNGWRGAGDYARDVLSNIGARGDSAILYAELEEHGDVYFPHFDDVLRLHPIQKLVDARIVPFLRKYVGAGTDGMLHSLCWLASTVDDVAVDGVLEQLFLRWTRRLRLRKESTRRDSDDIEIWRAFGSLTRSLRFRLIPAYDLRLMELLALKLPWYKERDIVEAMGHSERTYTRHEMLLFRAAPFEHYLRDEVDRLDDAADALFRGATAPNPEDE